MTSPQTIIQPLLTPVVMISACGLLCLAIYNRLAVVVNRLRIFHHERIGLLERINNLSTVLQRDPTYELLNQRLTMLEKQGDHILKRAKLLRGTLVGLVFCVLCMLSCSMFLGLSLVFPHADRWALGLFISGMISATLGMALAMSELLLCLSPIVLEAISVKELKSMSKSNRSRGKSLPTHANV